MSTLVGILRAQLAEEEKAPSDDELLTPELKALLLARQEAYNKGEKCYSLEETWQRLEEEWHVKL